MSTGTSRSDDAQVRHEAAEWLTRNDRELSAAEQDDFLQWLAADERHRVWFARHRLGWERLDALAAWGPLHGSEPNPGLLARPRPRVTWRRTALMALTAGLILGEGTIWWSQPAHPVATHLADGGEGGGYERRSLEDGSVVELNHDAEIEVNYSATERRVVLRRGEALFSVAKNPQRPFIVAARGVNVRAIGTAFNVRLKDEAVEVLVTEGKVQLAPLSKGSTKPASAETVPLVVAGERAVLSLVTHAVPQIVRASEAELNRLRAWQPQLLDFSSTPLSEVIAEFNRRNRVQIRLTDPSSAPVPIVASIRSENFEGLIQFVGSAAGLRAEYRGEYEIVLRAPK